MNKKNINITVKTVERCNIACQYCYFFFSEDESYKLHPIYIGLETINALTNFIKQGVLDFKSESVSIEFHGGEPMMQSPREFDFMCQKISQSIGCIAHVEFCMQTNGMLFNQHWLELIEKYQVKIGLSIDGPKEYHDKYRKYKNGRGSYDKVIEKLNLIRSSTYKLPQIGVLSVINPEFNAGIIYRHLVDDLMFKQIEFLLPFDTHERKFFHSQLDYSRYLCQLFDEWYYDDNPEINIKFIDSTLKAMLGLGNEIYGCGIPSKDYIPLICISSNGQLAPVDELRVTRFYKECVNKNNSKNVFNTTLKDFLNESFFSEIEVALNQIPRDCQGCQWRNICRGGGLINRYSEKSNFDNPSIFCNHLQYFYQHVTAQLLKCGFPQQKLIANRGS